MGGRGTSAFTYLKTSGNRKYRVLLVDDEPSARAMIAEILTRSGYSVDTAKDGADAWNALHVSSYDLLITDNRMPRVTGMELIQKLRSENIRLRVIMASGTVPVEELIRQPQMRLDAILAKPFAIAELLAVVRKVLGTGDDADTHGDTDSPSS
jgi:DNA-binding response OmpR family regulator